MTSEIDGVDAQIEMRGVTDTRRLYLVANTVFWIRTYTCLMVQGTGVGGNEVMCGTETVGDDEFGTMEIPDGTWEGQSMSPHVVLTLDASLQTEQFTCVHGG